MSLSDRLSSFLSPIDELSLYLRPPGQGIDTVSSGKKELLSFTKNYLGKSWKPDRPWRLHLEQLLKKKQESFVALLGVPSDTGAGIVRGANRGPEAIRKGFRKAPVFDLGDVFSVPFFIQDEMLSVIQLQSAREALFPDVASEIREQLFVSPVSMATRVYRLLRELCPQIKILILGGDHTVVWSAMEALFTDGLPGSEPRVPWQNQDVGIVHFDAHTDLLPQRNGVKCCFTTWAYHANDWIGRGQRLVQIGLRISSKPKAHWETTLGVKQIWADEALRLGPRKLGEKVIAHLQAQGVKRVYVSNDLDGTDSKWAAACGTPEPKGLKPQHVLAVLDALKKARFDILGADVVELAPGLSLSKKLSQISVKTAVQYAKKEIELLKS